MNEYITYFEKLQDFKNGKEIPWALKKMKNMYLAEAYKSFDEKKSARLLECSTTLVFKDFENGEKKLHSVNSCHVRLCPLCTWRRSLKTYYNTKRIIEYVEKEKKYAYIMLNLTCRNVYGPDLDKTIDHMFYAFKLFTKSAQFKRAVKGYYRGFEVTHNIDINSPWYDSFHPHYHVLLVVNKSYFTDKTYLSKNAWAELWQRSCGLDYDPIIHVEKIKDIDYYGAVAEVCKYATKDADYIIYDDWDLTCETVKVLDQALHNRRLCAYGGILKKAKHDLKIKDIENDSDLVNLGDENVEPDCNFVLSFYFWHTGYRQYIKGEPNI